MSVELSHISCPSVWDLPSVQIPIEDLILRITDQEYEEDDVSTLALSISMDGLFSALTVRPLGNVFEVMAGRRRLRAIAQLIEEGVWVADPDTGRCVPVRVLYRTLPCVILPGSDS